MTRTCQNRRAHEASSWPRVATGTDQSQAAGKLASRPIASRKRKKLSELIVVVASRTSRQFQA
ncbi:hypothetical protein D3C86_2078550 [compost metagenome]